MSAAGPTLSGDQARRQALDNIRLTARLIPVRDFAVSESGGWFHIRFDDRAGYRPSWDYAPSFRFDLERQAWRSRVGTTTFFTNLCPVFELIVELRGYLLLGDAAPDWNCLDLGPFWGVSGTYLAKRAGRGQTFFLEPDPRAAVRLRENLLLSGCDNASVLPLAAAGRSGRAPFHLDASDGSRLLGPQDSPDPGDPAVVTVQTASLPDLVARLGLARLDFVKMDVEGAEFELAEGLEALLARFPEMIVAMAAYHERHGETSAAFYGRRFAGHPFVRLGAVFPRHLTVFLVHADNAAALARLAALTPFDQSPAFGRRTGP